MMEVKMIDMADFQQLVEEAKEEVFGLSAKIELASFVVDKYDEFIRMYEESCHLQLKKLWEKQGYGKS